MLKHSFKKQHGHLVNVIETTDLQEAKQAMAGPDLFAAALQSLAIQTKALKALAATGLAHTFDEVGIRDLKKSAKDLRAAINKAGGVV